MTVTGILSSPSQRRTFLLATGAVLTLCIISILAVSYYAPHTPIWDSVKSLFISVVASGVFAIVASLYISFFFADPEDAKSQTTLLPQDIGKALQKIASRAGNYRIFVRTGRHFRAEILPMLVRSAIVSRHPIKIEVVLLDLRNNTVCEQYANYRKSSSFDRKLWDTSYVKKEVLATILALMKATGDNPGLLDIRLFLSSRLSTFRIEGSSDEILITREDPKDTATRYSRTHRDFGAFVTEFCWIRDEAYHITDNKAGEIPSSLREIFGESDEVLSLEREASRAAFERSPYVR